MNTTTHQPTILGAIAGDVIGSVYEWNNHKSLDIDLLPEKAHFSDDSVLTVAVADCILHQLDYATTLQRYARLWSDRGFGKYFREWMFAEHPMPYNSLGNGSAMRVSAAGFAAGSMEEALLLAKQSAEVTHNHPEGIKGAQAVAGVIYLARNGAAKPEIKQWVADYTGYDLQFTLDEIRENYAFDATCPGSVPQAIVAFMECNDVEHAIRLAISIGGDSDTLACMAGGMATAFYGEIPAEIIAFTEGLLPADFLAIIREFDEKYGKKVKYSHREVVL